MKNLTYIFTFILLTTFSHAQQVVPKETQLTQLSKAFGFVVGQNQTLAKISAEFPELSRNANLAKLTFDSSSLGKGATGVEKKLETILGGKMPEFKQTMNKRMQDYLKKQKFTSQQAKQFILEVNQRAKGTLPDSICSTLLSSNPSYMINPALEFTEGWKQKFLSKGHAKSKGMNITISYPKSWLKAEGQRPNILQKFAPNTNAPMIGVMLQTVELPKDLNRKLNQEEQKELASLELTKMFLPEKATIVSHKITKLDGQICSMTEYTLTAERAGIKIGQKMLTFIIPFNGKLLLINCSSGGEASNGYGEINDRYKKAKPLFLLISSSCVFTDKWKK